MQEFLSNKKGENGEHSDFPKTVTFSGTPIKCWPKGQSKGVFIIQEGKSLAKLKDLMYCWFSFFVKLIDDMNMIYLMLPK